MQPNDGISFVDADESRNQVRVGIARIPTEAEIAALSERVGVPAEALTFSLRAGRTTTASLLTDKHRPFGAGIQTTSNGASCSMGPNVTDSLGTRYFLTASHCSSFVGVVGTNFSQPSGLVTNIVGSDAVNPAWATSGCWMSGSICRATDAALIRLDTSSHLGKSIAISTIVGTGGGTGNLIIAAPFRTAVSATDLWFGAVATKTGENSGSTQGYVNCTCLIVNLMHNSQPVEVQCASSVAAFAGGGDSGGPVFRTTTPHNSLQRQPVGKVFGAFHPYAGGPIPFDEFYYNSWSTLQSDLGLTLYAN